MLNEVRQTAEELLESVLLLRADYQSKFRVQPERVLQRIPDPEEEEQRREQSLAFTSSGRPSASTNFSSVVASATASHHNSIGQRSSKNSVHNSIGASQQQQQQQQPISSSASVRSVGTSLGAGRDGIHPPSIAETVAGVSSPPPATREGSQRGSVKPSLATGAPSRSPPPPPLSSTEYVNVPPPPPLSMDPPPTLPQSLQDAIDALMELACYWHGALEWLEWFLTQEVPRLPPTTPLLPALLPFQMELRRQHYTAMLKRKQEEEEEENRNRGIHPNSKPRVAFSSSSTFSGPTGKKASQGKGSSPSKKTGSSNSILMNNNNNSSTAMRRRSSLTSTATFPTTGGQQRARGLGSSHPDLRPVSSSSFLLQDAEPDWSAGTPHLEERLYPRPRIDQLQQLSMRHVISLVRSIQQVNPFAGIGVASSAHGVNGNNGGNDETGPGGSRMTPAKIYDILGKKNGTYYQNGASESGGADGVGVGGGGGGGGGGMPDTVKRSSISTGQTLAVPSSASVSSSGTVDRSETRAMASRDGAGGTGSKKKPPSAAQTEVAAANLQTAIEHTVALVELWKGAAVGAFLWPLEASDPSSYPREQFRQHCALLLHREAHDHPVAQALQRHLRAIVLWVEEEVCAPGEDGGDLVWGRTTLHYPIPVRLATSLPVLNADSDETEKSTSNRGRRTHNTAIAALLHGENGTGASPFNEQNCFIEDPALHRDSENPRGGGGGVVARVSSLTAGLPPASLRLVGLLNEVQGRFVTLLHEALDHTHGYAPRVKTMTRMVFHAMKAYHTVLFMGLRLPENTGEVAWTGGGTSEGPNTVNAGVGRPPAAPPLARRMAALSSSEGTGEERKTVDRTAELAAAKIPPLKWYIQRAVLLIRRALDFSVQQHQVLSAFEQTSDTVPLSAREAMRVDDETAASSSSQSPTQPREENPNQEKNTKRESNKSNTSSTKKGHHAPDRVSCDPLHRITEGREGHMMCLLRYLAEMLLWIEAFGPAPNPNVNSAHRIETSENNGVGRTGERNVSGVSPAGAGPQGSVVTSRYATASAAAAGTPDVAAAHLRPSSSSSVSSSAFGIQEAKTNGAAVGPQGNGATSPFPFTFATPTSFTYPPPPPPAADNSNSPSSDAICMTLPVRQYLGQLHGAILAYVAEMHQKKTMSCPMTNMIVLCAVALRSFATVADPEPPFAAEEGGIIGAGRRPGSAGTWFGAGGGGRGGGSSSSLRRPMASFSSSHDWKYNDGKSFKEQQASKKTSKKGGGDQEAKTAATPTPTSGGGRPASADVGPRGKNGGGMTPGFGYPGDVIRAAPTPQLPLSMLPVTPPPPKPVMYSPAPLFHLLAVLHRSVALRYPHLRRVCSAAYLSGVAYQRALREIRTSRVRPSTTNSTSTAFSADGLLSVFDTNATTTRSAAVAAAAPPPPPVGPTAPLKAMIPACFSALELGLRLLHLEVEVVRFAKPVLLPHAMAVESLAGIFTWLSAPPPPPPGVAPTVYTSYMSPSSSVIQSLTLAAACCGQGVSPGMSGPYPGNHAALPVYGMANPNSSGVGMSGPLPLGQYQNIQSYQPPGPPLVSAGAVATSCLSPLPVYYPPPQHLLFSAAYADAEQNLNDIRAQCRSVWLSCQHENVPEGEQRRIFQQWDVQRRLQWASRHLWWTAGLEEALKFLIKSERPSTMDMPYAHTGSSSSSVSPTATSSTNRSTPLDLVPWGAWFLPPPPSVAAKPPPPASNKTNVYGAPLQETSSPLEGSSLGGSSLFFQEERGSAGRDTAPPARVVPAAPGQPQPQSVPVGSHQTLSPHSHPSGSDVNLSFVGDRPPSFLLQPQPPLTSRTTQPERESSPPPAVFDNSGPSAPSPSLQDHNPYQLHNHNVPSSPMSATMKGQHPQSQPPPQGAMPYVNTSAAAYPCVGGGEGVPVGGGGMESNNKFYQPYMNPSSFNPAAAEAMGYPPYSHADTDPWSGRQADVTSGTWDTGASATPVATPSPSLSPGTSSRPFTANGHGQEARYPLAYTAGPAGGERIYVNQDPLN